MHLHVNSNIGMKSKLPWLILHFSQLKSIHVIGTNNKIEGNNKLSDFLQ